MTILTISTMEQAVAIEWPGRWAVKVATVDGLFPNPFFVPEAPQEDGKLGREQVVTFCAANDIPVCGKFIPTMAQAEVPEDACAAITQEG